MIEDAFIEIERRFHRPVTYESPWPPPAFERMNIPAPAPGSSARDAVNRALEAYRRGGGTAAFRVEEAGQFIHVIGVRDAGPASSDETVLGQRISMPQKTASAMEWLEQFAGILSDGAGVQISVGTVPTNRLMQHTFPEQARNIPARACLRLLSVALGAPISWSLLFDRREPSGALNIRLLD
jgi:hypothetical protein